MLALCKGTDGSPWVGSHSFMPPSLGPQCLVAEGWGVGAVVPRLSGTDGL